MQTENFGKPLKLFEFSSDERDNFSLDEIEKFFNNPKIKERKVVILSIVGAFRRGKSFFLDYCLRYLYANYDSINQTNFVRKSNWMGEENEKLSGFSWRSGCDRDTTGIVFWSDVFLYEERGEKFAIFIADTQGLFDHETTSSENVKVFSLVSLMSSIQLINLTGNIREDELQYVSFAMEFAKYVKPNISKPYQNIVFLIRDWQNEDDFPYGQNGGQNYLQKVLRGKSNQNKEFSSIRDFLLTSCEDLQCFLLPYPGRNVVGKRNFDGNWAQLGKDFKDELKITIESLLSARNLVVKKVAGKELTVAEFLPYLKQYFKFFTTKEMPRAANVFENIVKIEMDQLVEKYLTIYNRNIEIAIISIKDKNQILEVHEKHKNYAVREFNDCEKLGSNEHIVNAEKSLKTKIEDAFKKWSENKTNQLEKEELQRQHELKSKELKKSQEDEKKLLAEKVESLQSELTNARITRSVAPVNRVYEPCYSPPTPSYTPDFSSSIAPSRTYAPSFSSPSVSSSSGRGASSWNQHQKYVSANVWSGMSASERKSAGNFNTFAAASYRGGKRK